MTGKIKHSFLGYFNFFYKIIGARFILDIFLCLCVSFLDGMGLAMFIPLLQSLDGEQKTTEANSTLNVINSLFNSLSIPINIYTVLVALSTLFVLKGILKFFQYNFQFELRQICMKKMNYSLTDSLQNLSYDGFLKLDAGRIQNTLTTEIAKLMLSIFYYLQSISMLAMLTTYIVFAFFTNWQFALMVVVGAGLSNLLFRKIFVTVKKTSVNISQKGNLFNSYLIQAVLHFKYLKATNYFDAFSKRLKTVIDDTAELNRKIGFNQAITISTKEPLVILIVAVVIILQINIMGASLSTILLSLFLFYRALTSLLGFQNYWQSFVQNVGALDAVSALETNMKSMQEHQGAVNFDGFQKGISIVNVNFSYGSNPVLKDIELHIPKNTSIALVGESGSGKTTLANLIIGLFKPQSGEILLDEISIDRISIDKYRDRIGYISQDPVIFNDIIFNNITFWDVPSPENLERFWHVIEISLLTDFISQSVHKENTMLGDNGLMISGGQKQRISIARELYKKTEILILDEATSALDSQTERLIQTNIEQLHGSYTMIIIAHRLSTIRNVDKIYLLENGRIAAQGNYDEMLLNSEKFKRMVSLQEV